MQKIILAAVAALVATTAVASADSITRRQNQQADRIEQGRKSGTITWTEGVKLRAEQKRIARVEDAYRDKGYLTRAERREINKMQNQASKNITAEKYDSKERPSWLPRVGK